MTFEEIKAKLCRIIESTPLERREQLIRLLLQEAKRLREREAQA